ncbi:MULTISPECIES: hypothetical protein [Pseudonocardia]|nr:MULTISPECIES: hypothetical protein [Pseudonocardia]
MIGCECIEFAAMDQRLGACELGALRGLLTWAHVERPGYARP